MKTTDITLEVIRDALAKTESNYPCLCVPPGKVLIRGVVYCAKHDLLQLGQDQTQALKELDHYNKIIYDHYLLPIGLCTQK